MTTRLTVYIDEMLNYPKVEIVRINLYKAVNWELLVVKHVENKCWTCRVWMVIEKVVVKMMKKIFLEKANLIPGAASGTHCDFMTSYGNINHSSLLQETQGHSVSIQSVLMYRHDGQAGLYQATVIFSQCSCTDMMAGPGCTKLPWHSVTAHVQTWWPGWAVPSYRCIQSVLMYKHDGWAGLHQTTVVFSQCSCTDMMAGLYQASVVFSHCSCTDMMAGLGCTKLPLYSVSAHV